MRVHTFGSLEQSPPGDLRERIGLYLKFRNLLWQMEEYLLDTANISDPDRTAPSDVS